MSIRVVFIIIAALLVFSSSAFALESSDFDFISSKTFAGAEKKAWNQAILFDAPSLPGTPFSLSSFSWTFLLGGFKKDADVSFTAKFDGIAIDFSGHTTAGGRLLTTRSVTDAVTLGRLAAAFSDGTVRITLDQKHAMYFSGGAGSGHVAPEPATLLLIGAGLAGLPIARRLKNLNRNS